MIRKQLVKDNKKKNIYIFLLFIVVILAYHFLLREYIGDFREMFSPLMDTDTLGEALRKRYETWSSRVFIEAPLILPVSYTHLDVYKRQILYDCRSK